MQHLAAPGAPHVQSQNTIYLLGMHRFPASLQALNATLQPTTATVHTARGSSARLDCNTRSGPVPSPRLCQVFHGGKQHNLDAARVRRMYGQHVEQWLAARRRLLGEAERRLFSEGVSELWISCYMARPNSYRLMNSPITRSCRRSVLEKQSVRRTKLPWKKD